MSKERDLMDYAQLGLSAATAYKVGEMAAELAKLRESSDRQERKNQRLSQMRQMILMAEEFLERLEGDATGKETPLKLQFVYAYETERDLKTAGVLPPLEFESWEDKERASNLEKRIDQFRDDLRKRLPDDQRREAELCVNYMSQEPDLKSLMMLRSVAEGGDKIKAKRAEIVSKQQEIARYPLPPHIKVFVGPSATIVGGIAWLSCLVGAAWFIAAVVAGADTYGASEEDVRRLRSHQAVSFIVLCLSVTILALRRAVRRQFAPQEYRKLLSEKEALMREIGDLEQKHIDETGEEYDENDERTASVTSLVGKDEKTLVAKFAGEHSLERLRAVYIERRDFVRGIVGPRYLASQDGGKKAAAHTSGDADEEGTQSA